MNNLHNTIEHIIKHDSNHTETYRSNHVEYDNRVKIVSSHSYHYRHDCPKVIGIPNIDYNMKK